MGVHCGGALLQVDDRRGASLPLALLPCAVPQETREHGCCLQADQGDQAQEGSRVGQAAAV